LGGVAGKADIAEVDGAGHGEDTAARAHAAPASSFAVAASREAIGDRQAGDIDRRGRWRVDEEDAKLIIAADREAAAIDGTALVIAVSSLDSVMLPVMLMVVAVPALTARIALWSEAVSLAVTACAEADDDASPTPRSAIDPSKAARQARRWTRANAAPSLWGTPVNRRLFRGPR
jgi:hypothetical protein